MALDTNITAAMQAIAAEVNQLRSEISTRKAFLVRDDGLTGQLTTGSNVDLAGIWAAPEKTDPVFSWNGTTGELGFTEAGELEIAHMVHSYNNLNNRHELHVQLMHDDGGGYSVWMESSTYTSRNNTQDEGGVPIPPLPISVTTTDKFKLRIRDIGVAATVGAPEVAQQTLIVAYLNQTG